LYDYLAAVKGLSPLTKTCRPVQRPRAAFSRCQAESHRHGPGWLTAEPQLTGHPQRWRHLPQPLQDHPDLRAAREEQSAREHPHHRSGADGIPRPRLETGHGRELRRLDPDLPLPRYAHPGDAGADLMAAEDVELAPGERALVRTGVAIALLEGYVGLVHPRSGLAARLGVTVINAPGTVDAGYRGEIMVNLVNHDRVTTAKISRGDRIAQLVVQRVERAHFVVADELPETQRGSDGHGSTGGHAGLGPAVHLEEQ